MVLLLLHSPRATLAVDPAVSSSVESRVRCRVGSLGRVGSDQIRPGKQKKATKADGKTLNHDEVDEKTSSRADSNPMCLEEK